MKAAVIALSSLIVLTACDTAENRTRDFRYQMGKEYDDLRYKLSNYVYDHNDSAPGPVQPMPYFAASYCYRVTGDIVCYRSPQSDLQERFIGMQGENGSYYADVPVYGDDAAPRSASNFDYHREEIAPSDSDYTEKVESVELPSVSANSAKETADANAPIELMPAF